jgi:hypothetical protein
VLHWSVQPSDVSPKAPHAFESEREALSAVLASGVFLPTSNLARILSFICEKHFEAPDRELSEYDIATGALGRRSEFDSRRDSVVRVEMHRLRKRLGQFYEAEGCTLPVRIVLPPGQYTPQFRRIAGPEADTQAERNPGRRLSWLWAIPLALAVLAGAIWVVGSQRRPAAALRSDAIPAVATGPEVRLLAGYPGGKYIEPNGSVWSGDAYFEGGTAAEVRYGRLLRTSDPALYRHARRGFDFSYSIPLQPGVYELRLYFAESSESVPIVGESGESLRRFSVTANGKPLLPPQDKRHVRQFDISSDAGGDDLADVKVFKDVSPAPDGKLHLHFVSAKQEAQVNAIEIVPGAPGKLRSIRLRAGDRAFVDRQGNTWLPDSFVQGGRLSIFKRPISGTDAPDLFQGERFGHFRYAIPVPPGRYTVSLGFAENFHTVWDRTPGAGVRLFNVYINGVLRLRDFDVFAKSGGALQAITRVFRDVEPTPQDKIEIAFEPVTESAIVNTVEIADQGQ